MSIKVRYRPLAGIVTISNMELEDTEEYEQYHYPEGEAFHITTAWVGDKDYVGLYYMTIIDFHGAGSSWSVFASEFLPDDTIASIYELVDGWRNHWTMATENMSVATRAMSKYETYLDTTMLS